MGMLGRWRAWIGWALLLTALYLVSRYEPELLKSWVGNTLAGLLLIWGFAGFRPLPLRWQQWRKSRPRSWVLLIVALALLATLAWYPPAHAHPTLVTLTLLGLLWSAHAYAYSKDRAWLTGARMTGLHIPDGYCDLSFASGEF